MGTPICDPFSADGSIVSTFDVLWNIQGYLVLQSRKDQSDVIAPDYES